MADRPSVYARYPRNNETAREVAKRMGTSARTAQRWTSRSRAEWLQQKADEREEIRAFHDDQGHSWSETAARYRLDISTVKRRAYRARKERAEERMSRDSDDGNS